MKAIIQIALGVTAALALTASASQAGAPSAIASAVANPDPAGRGPGARYGAQVPPEVIAFSGHAERLEGRRVHRRDRLFQPHFLRRRRAQRAIAHAYYPAER